MAVVWTIEIQVTNLATREVIVRGTRTDGADVWTDTIVGKYDTANHTPQELLATYTDGLWNLYQLQKTKEANIAALIGQAESALANALNAKEAE